MRADAGLADLRGEGLHRADHVDLAALEGGGVVGRVRDVDELHVLVDVDAVLLEGAAHVDVLRVAARRRDAQRLALLLALGDQLFQPVPIIGLQGDALADDDLRPTVHLAGHGHHVETLIERRDVVQVGDLGHVDALRHQRGQHVVAGVEVDRLNLHTLGEFRGQRHRQAMGAFGEAQLQLLRVGGLNGGSGGEGEEGGGDGRQGEGPERHERSAPDAVASLLLSQGACQIVYNIIIANLLAVFSCLEHSSEGWPRGSVLA